MENIFQGKYLEGIKKVTKIECNVKQFVEEGDGNTRKRKNYLQKKYIPGKNILERH